MTGPLKSQDIKLCRCCWTRLGVMHIPTDDRLLCAGCASYFLNRSDYDASCEEAL